jgi:D-sedoheptulose 7-phosphate isomerase
MSIVEDYKKELAVCLDAIDEEAIDACAEVYIKAWKEKKTIYVCGNGGSASTASHVACDLNKGATVSGVRRLRVVGLADNIAHLTALANDFDYSEIFTEQLKNLLEPGDVVIGISASGNSPNCVKAFQYARDNGATTMGWLGFTGGEMKGLSDVCIHLPSVEYGPVEDGHLIINHMLTIKLKDWFEKINRE